MRALRDCLGSSAASGITSCCNAISTYCAAAISLRLRCDRLRQLSSAVSARLAAGGSVRLPAASDRLLSLGIVRSSAMPARPASLRRRLRPACPISPKICAIICRTSSVPRSGAEPRHRVRIGEVPVRSPRARRSRGSPGSAAHARRSAARVSSAGTPGARKARMSVPRVIEFERRQAREIELGLRRACGCGLASASPALAAARVIGVAAVSASRLRGASSLRARPRACGATSASGNPPARVIRRPLRAGARRASASGSARSRLRLKNPRSTWCSATNAATVSRIDVRHRHRLDDIVAGLGHAFALGRIGGHETELVGRLGARSRAAPPTAPARRSRDCRDSSPVSVRCSSISARPGIERRALAVVGEHGPRRACPARRPAPRPAAR